MNFCESLEIYTTPYRFLRASYNNMSWVAQECPNVGNVSLSSYLYWHTILNSCEYLKSQTHVWNAQVKKASFVNKGIGKIGLELLLLVVGCVTWFQLILVHFELLQILVQPKDLNICFSQPWKFIPWRL